MFISRNVLYTWYILLVTSTAPLLSTTNTTEPAPQANEGSTVLSPTQVDALVDNLFEEIEKNNPKENVSVNVSVAVNTKKALKEKLKQYKVTGFGTGWDANFALIYNNQNPRFDIAFVNDKGEVKTQTFQTSIKSLGYKCEISLKYNLMLFTNTDVNYLHSMKKIKLGKGIDISFPFYYPLGHFNLPIDGPLVMRLPLGSLICCFTYVPFLNAPGGMIMLGVGIATQGVGKTWFSLVYDGYLKPLKGAHTNDDDDEDEDED